jgi:hypothetical protein
MAALIGGELIAYYVGKYEFRLTATRHRITRTEWSDVRHPDNLFMSRRIDGQLNPSLSGCHGQIPFVNEREFDAWMRQQARPDHSLPEIQDQRSSGRRERTTPLDVKSKENWNTHGSRHMAMPLERSTPTGTVPKSRSIFTNWADVLEKKRFDRSLKEDTSLQINN